MATGSSLSSQEAAATDDPSSIPSPVWPSPHSPSPVRPSSHSPSPVRPFSSIPSPVLPSPHSPSPVRPSSSIPSLVRPDCSARRAAELQGRVDAGDGVSGGSCRRVILASVDEGGFAGAVPLGKTAVRRSRRAPLVRPSAATFYTSSGGRTVRPSVVEEQTSRASGVIDQRTLHPSRRQCSGAAPSSASSAPAPLRQLTRRPAVSHHRRNSVIYADPHRPSPPTVSGVSSSYLVSPPPPRSSSSVRASYTCELYFHLRPRDSDQGRRPWSPLHRP